MSDIYIDNSWGMFSKQGNKSVRNKLIWLRDKLEESDKLSEKVRRIEQFCDKFTRLYTTKTMDEAMDSAVRHGVERMANKICEEYLPHMWKFDDICEL